MVEMPVVLTIASSDNSGGAGIQMDLYAFSMLKVHGCSVITAITAQNSREFQMLDLIPETSILGQLDATTNDLDVRAIKTGLLGSIGTIIAVAGYLDKFIKSKDTEFCGLVVDPVLGSTVAGTFNDQNELISSISSKLIPLSYILTPNIPEAEAILGREINTDDEDEQLHALKDLQDLGAKNVLLKTGHASPAADGKITDLLLDGSGKLHKFSFKREIEGPVHGTGCMLSALITAHLGLGFTSAYQAVAGAESVLHECLKHTERLGKGELKYFGTDDCGSWQMHQARVADDLSQARKKLLEILTAELVPEVGINFGYALPAARHTNEICAMEARIVRTGDGIISTGGIAPGASSHVARIILSAMAFDLRYRSAVNLRYSEALVAAAVSAQYAIGTFSRENEPEGESTMEWGTRTAIAELGSVPDVIYDPGGFGKEPMVRVLGCSPAEVVDKVKKLKQHLA